MKNLFLLLYVFFSSTFAVACEGEITPIAQVQGINDKSPLIDQLVTVKAVVTGVFTQPGELNGFFVQSLQDDDNPSTSEGLFVYTGHWQPDINKGDVVMVTGQVSERHNLTQLLAITQVKKCATDQLLPAIREIPLPLDMLNLESLENMRVSVTDATVTDVYQYIKFGELTVSSERMFSTTTLVEPGMAVEPLRQSQKRNQLVIDDGRLKAYARPFSVGRYTDKQVSGDNPMRTGYSVDAQGILNYVFGHYKLQVTNQLKVSPQSNFRNQQPDRPEGVLSVATFNVENWFTDLNDGGDRCGNIVGMGCRGAKSDMEKQRQLNKLVTVINRLDASIIGLQELQNNPNESIQTLVNALNKDAYQNKWNYVDSGQLGQDVIKVGLIYQPGEVQVIGDYAILNRESTAEYEDHRNRVVLAQTFEHSESGQLMTVASLHLKSKGCRDAEGENMAQNDGQGCYNPTRQKAAQQIVSWLNQDPTQMGAEWQLVMGDFNSYQMEDPIKVFEESGYINLAREFLGVENWTSSYRGKVGSLDYIMANKVAAEHATGVTQWHINADEIRDFGYRMTPLSETVARPDNFYQVSPFSSSDHDPVLAGFDLSDNSGPKSKESQ